MNVSSFQFLNCSHDSFVENILKIYNLTCLLPVMFLNQGTLLDWRSNVIVRDLSLLKDRTEKPFCFFPVDRVRLRDERW